MDLKRYFLIIGLLFAATISISAQTYYYKYLYTVNGAGQKFIDKSYQSRFNSQSPKYITFSNSKQSVSLTDANGISNAGTYYQYMGQENGIREYRLSEPELKFANPMTGQAGITPQNAYNAGAAYMETINMGGGTIRMFFSSDYSRINIQSNSGTHVLQRTSAPDSQRRPSQLY